MSASSGSAPVAFGVLLFLDSEIISRINKTIDAALCKNKERLYSNQVFTYLCTEYLE